jgi:hypothetical protein
MGQNKDTLLNILFYKINPDLLRKTICRMLRHDKRFAEIIRPNDDTSEFNIGGFTFYGRVLDNGVIPNKPDSAKMQVSYGTSFSEVSSDKKIKANAPFDYSYIQYEYFFDSKENMEKAYDYILFLMQSTGKKMSDDGFGPTYPKGEIGTGKRYFYESENSFKPYVSLLKVTLATRKFITFIKR